MRFSLFSSLFCNVEVHVIFFNVLLLCFVIYGRRKKPGTSWTGPSTIAGTWTTSSWAVAFAARFWPRPSRGCQTRSRKPSPRYMRDRLQPPRPPTPLLRRNHRCPHPLLYQVARICLCADPCFMLVFLFCAPMNCLLVLSRRLFCASLDLFYFVFLSPPPIVVVSKTFFFVPRFVFF